MKPIFSQGQSSSWPKNIVIHTDGASRGNPGMAAIGFSVSSQEGIVYEYGEVLGIQTNNFAEYQAVHKALSLAVQNQVKELTVCSDSQLLVRQMSGLYKVKSSSLKSLYRDCLSLAQKISFVLFKHVMREDNKRADEIANIVLDKWQKKRYS